ncbi:MAG: hypothetical protein E7302_02195 [Butyrivibrio sp.]|nr:hypothetical protein [Butyrivibrio sp.]
MEKVTFKKEYLTSHALAILNNREGFRDDTLFPRLPELQTDKNNPFDVVTTEILSCGKYEICSFIQMHYLDYLSKRDYRFLDEVIAVIKTIGYPIIDYEKKEQLLRIISKLIDKSNYCVWLCSSAEDIYNYYIKDYIPRADKISEGYAASCPDFEIKSACSLDEYANKYVSKIQLPDEFTFLCDLGEAGALMCFDGLQIPQKSN